MPRTLESLAKSGFTDPRLLIDDCDHLNKPSSILEFIREGLDLTIRYPRIQAFANWILALAEIYLREPTADRYALFQDDFVCSLGLKQYLEKTTTHDRSYWNIYTFPVNQSLCPDCSSGWFRSDQRGRSAVGLVFTLEGVLSLLSSSLIWEKPRRARHPNKGIDGIVSDHFSGIGWTEMIHNPSLTQHTGHNSSMGNKRHPQALSFRGEDFDLRDLLPNDNRN